MPAQPDGGGERPRPLAVASSGERDKGTGEDVVPGGGQAGPEADESVDDPDELLLPRDQGRFQPGGGGRHGVRQRRGGGRRARRSDPGNSRVPPAARHETDAAEHERSAAGDDRVADERRAAAPSGRRRRPRHPCSTRVEDADDAAVLEPGVDGERGGDDDLSPPWGAGEQRREHTVGGDGPR